MSKRKLKRAYTRWAIAETFFHTVKVSFIGLCVIGGLFTYFYFN